MRKLEKENIEDILPLTPMQEGMLFHYLKDPESDHYFEQLSLEISGEINNKHFENAWNVVIQANEMLRTVFRWEKLEKPIQIILKEHKLQPIYCDFTNVDFSQTKEHMEKVKAKDRSEKFDLGKVPFRITLCKLEETRYEMIISSHHILYDGWSNGIILKESFTAYDGLCTLESLIPPFKTKFKEFVKWHQNQDQEKQNRFWEDHLNDFDTQTVLPVKAMKQNPGHSVMEDYRLVLEKDIKNKLEIFLKENRLTLANFFYCTWGILLQKYCNTHDVVFGTVVSGRSAPIKDIKKMVGLFINTIPLRVKGEPGDKVLDLLFKVSNILTVREKYENTPLVDIKRCRRLETGEEFFDSIVVIENYPLDSRLFMENSQLKVKSYAVVERTHYDLTVGIMLFDHIELIFTYDKDIFNEETIVRLSNHFRCICETIIKCPGKEVAHLDILSKVEREQVLYDFNATACEYPKDKTIWELFENQAEKSPGNTALIFKDKQLSYRHLHEKTDQLANRFREKGVKTDTIVGLMVERSLEMIIGILAILKAGGAYLPIDPEYPQERLNYMLTDSRAKILVTTRDLSKEIEFEKEIIYLSDAINRVPTPFHPSILPSFHLHLSPWVNAPVTSLAYVIYTSGSSGKPKGVLIEHFSVINLAFFQKSRFDINMNDRILQFSSICFDASVEQIFIAFFSGAALVLIEKSTLLDPYEFDFFVSHHSITHIHAVPSLLANMRLSDTGIPPVKRIISGGDLCPVSLAKTWSACGDFYNEYGPTETTVTSIELKVKYEDVEETLSRLPIGRPIGNTTVYLFNRWLNLVPLGVVGELYIGGDGVARGYLNRPELTNYKFLIINDKLKNNQKFLQGVQGGGFLEKSPPYASRSRRQHIYRTGDLARWLSNGNIEFLGRIDQQVKIRGFRIEPEEIANQLLRHETIKDAVVVVKENETGDKYLVAYIVSHGEVPVPITGLKDYLLEVLPDYMIPSCFMPLSEIPLTPNGKIDRRALPEPEAKPYGEYVAPRNEMERKLVVIWAELLLLDAPIGIDDNFFQLGGHSLKATALIAKLHKFFNVKVPLVYMFKNPTIRGLSRYIRNGVEDGYRPIEAVEEKEYYGLSSAQKRLYFLQQMDETATGYNMPRAWFLKGGADKDKLESTFQKLVQRHGSLRTSFKIINSGPVQRVPPEVEFKIEYYDARRKAQSAERKEGRRAPSAMRCANAIKDFVRPFDLSKAPLMRVALMKIETGRYILVVDMHHIIADGISIQALIRDFMALYSGKELVKMRLRYKDFTQWQNREKKSARVQKQAQYWKREFQAEIPVIDLPTDYARPAVQRFKGSHLNFAIDSGSTGALKALALEEGVTLYMVLLAFYTIFLSKISNQEDIVVGASLAGRQHADLGKIIGMFVNTFPIWNYPAGGKTFLKFLSEVKEKTLQAFENQEYQYEDLVEQVIVDRDVSRNPLFDTSFLLQNVEVSKLAIPGLKLTPYEHETITSKFDLTLETIETGEVLLFRFLYSTNLFKPETIERFANYFKNLVSGIHENKKKKLSEMEILSEEEKNRLLYEFNDTKADCPKDKLLHQLFEEQAERTLNQVALIGKNLKSEIRNPKHQASFGKILNAFGEGHLSYKELNEIANQLAHRLREKGVKPDSIVGIMIERSIEMIVGILAILKAGGAYLPIDPDYPGERINYMLADSAVKIWLTSDGINRVPTPHRLSFPLSTLPSYSTSTCQVSPTNLAYVVYTSGSTGKPKGVLVQHFSVINLAFFQKSRFDIDINDRILQFSSICFDASVEQIFIAFFSGAALVLIEKSTLLDPYEFDLFVSHHSITHIHAVPSFLVNMRLSDTGISPVKRIISGGDLCPLSLAERWHSCGDFYNEYGPTETTVTSIELMVKGKDVDETLSRLSIGKPIGNTTVYLFDRWLNLVPLGVVGELYIGGDGVARGYLNRPELTNYKFLINKKLLQGVQIFAVRQAPCAKRLPPGRRRQKIYRTGDLARWLSNGDIEFLGRIDYQVKIRGFRIELEEIECQLLTHSGIKDAVVLSRADESGDKYLCAYVVPGFGEPGQVFDGSGLKEYLLKFLPDYMVPAYIIEIDEIPLTNSGKIDRGALPAPVISVSEEYAAPCSEIEKKLVEIWVEVLFGRDAANAPANKLEASIGIDANFFQLGGHSLKAIALVSKVHKVFDVKLPLVEIFKRPTIRGLSQYIRHGVEYPFASIKVVEEKEYYSLSSAQKRLFFLHQMDETNTAYNMSSAWVLEGDLDKDKLEQTFRTLIRRHESLRTYFEIVDEEPVQRIYNEVNFKIEYFGGPRPYARTIKKFIRPFDLSQPPLLRVGLIKEENKKHILMVDMHHMISDGTSIGILAEEFMALYDGQELPAQRLQYTDFSEWQKRMYHRGVLEEQEQYWLQQMAGEIPKIHLATDFLRPAVQTFEGSTRGFEIGSAKTNALKALALEGNSTLFMVIVTLANIFLGKLSSQEDILIGIPAAGRRHTDLENIVGMFVNTLVLRNHPTKQTTIKELLKGVNQKTINAFENQDYQYESLVERVAVERDTSRNPLFDVMLVFQNLEIPGLEIPGLQMAPYPYKNKTSKFDLTLYAEEKQEILQCRFEYSTNLFKPSTIERFIAYFNQIAASVVRDPGIEIGEIEIITESEKKQILLEFNGAVRAFPGDKTLMHLFEEQVERTPHCIALISKGQRSQLSYKELNEKSNQLARVLKEKGAGANAIVGLMVDRSIEMMMGLYGILKAGGTYMPLAPDYPSERIRYMLEESSSRILMTQEKYLTSVTFEGEILNLQDESLYFYSYQHQQGSPPRWDTSPEELVYVIYTSGSTGKPKGVPIKTRAFVNLVNWYIKEFELNAGDGFLLMAPISFDLTQKNLFAPLFVGGCLCLPSPGLHNYDELSDFIALEQQTVINCAPSVFYPFVAFNSDDGFKQLQSLRYVFLGGESIQMDQLMPWLESENCGCDIVNTYGPTECTDVVSFYRIPVPKDKKPYPRNIPIGGPVDNVTLYVLDDRQKMLPVGFMGEVCIGGLGVSRGYLNNPESTAERFLHMSYIYRTGDLGRWLEDGSIEFLGRIDQQVKVRGLRIELGEIENQLLKHEEVKETAVVAIADEARGNYLCGYIVPHSPGTLSASVILELKEYLSKHLPDYMIPGYFVELEALPLTPSGKVDRKVLPLPQVELLRATYMAPQNPTEEKLAEIWSELLGIEKDRISINANFFELGGHSLTATILVSKIHKELNVKVPLADIFGAPTIRELSAYIINKRKDLYSSIEPAEEKEFYALSSVQKRLYVIQQLDVNRTVYNISFALLLEGKVDRGKLEEIFRKLIQRHESLRTSFEIVNGETVQRVYENFDFKINYFDFKIDQVEVKVEEKEGTRGLAPMSKEYATGNRQLAASTIKNFIRPFDLSQAPLLRVGLMEVDQDTNVLLLDMHHIVSDGISCGIMVKEFMVLAAGEKLPDLRFQYKDYSEWQKGEKQRGALTKQKSYWKKQFDAEIPVLDLPTDFTRPAVQTFEGSRVTFEIYQEEVAALKSLALAEGITFYMVMLAIYNIFLSRLSNQEDIIVGTPTTGRRHADLEPIMGMFVNTLVLRNYPCGEKSFPVFLKEIKERSLEAFDTQDYQLEDLVDQVLAARDTSRNPLFDTMFVIQNTTIPEIELTGLKLSPIEYQGGTSKFDLLLIGVEAEDKLSLTFEYSTRLFTTATIQRFIGYFNKIVSTIIGNPTVKLSEIEIISEKEKQQVLFAFNNTHRKYPGEKTIQQLFEGWVEKTPDHIAIVGQGLKAQDPGHRNFRDSVVDPQDHPTPGKRHLTYWELAEKSNRLAHWLRQKGIGPDTIVGLMIERSLEMIIGILGILKADGAYLPIELGYPGERINYMLTDSNAKILVKYSNNFSNYFVKEGIDVIYIDDHNVYSSWPKSTSYHLHPLPWVNAPATSLAYIIYTSGSTGKPKGVLTTHYNVTRVVRDTNYIGLTEKDKVLQLSNYAFDGSVFDIYGALLNGAALVMLPPGKATAVNLLEEIITKEQVTVFFVTTALFNLLVDEAPCIFDNIRKILFGGERVSVEHVKKALGYSGEGKVMHVYGPTETTVYATFYHLNTIEENAATIPIGLPLSNTTVYILDNYLKPVPVGVIGEIYIGGYGTARGYLNQPELTTEKIIPSPFIQRDRLYKTGDLAKWLPDGNVEFSGRIDHQVKIRGFRIEPGEIEKHLLKHPNIKEAVVLVKENNTKEKYLCAYMILDKELSPAQLREFLSVSLPTYMIPSYFVCLDKMPLNANGKIDTKELPEPAAAAAEGKYIAPRNTIEEKLSLIWTEILSITSSRVSIDSDFFEIGGHSLKALHLLNAVQKEFNVKIDFQDIFQYPTIAGLSRLIRKSDPAVGHEIQPQPEKEYYDLSYSQWRLMVLYQLDPDSPAFNLPTRITLYEPLDEIMIRKVLEKLVKRHESFRTYFKSLQGEPVQIIRPHLRVNPEVRDLSHLSDTELEKNRQQLFRQERLQPFKLDIPPLFRVKLIKCRKEEFDLILIMHHIITDGWSMEVLEHEFTLLYEAYKKGEEYDPGPLKIRYFDYVYWHNRLLGEKEKMRKAKEFWKSQLNGNCPILELPYDYSKKNLDTKKSAAYRTVVPEKTAQELRKVAKACNASLFMVLLAGFNVLLYRITRQYDILLAVPGAARQHEDLRNIVGFFVNTLIIKSKINPDETFSDFLAWVQNNTLQALEYQSFPLELMCSEFKIPYPEINVFFNMITFDNARQQDLRDTTSYHIEAVQDTKFDMVSYLEEYKNGITIETHYYKGLFKPITIEKIMQLYQVMLKDICAESGKKIREYKTSLSGKKRRLKPVMERLEVYQSMKQEREN